MVSKIFGRNPVLEALRAGVRIIHKVILAQGVKGPLVSEIVSLAHLKGIPVEYEEREKLGALVGNRAHQGVVALASPLRQVRVREMLMGAKERGEIPLLLILDGIEDPHNLGSILRTAEAVGAHGVIIPKRRAVGVTSTVVKTSAGATEYIKVAQVANLASTIGGLKEEGLWVVGTDAQAEATIYEMEFNCPLALVIGGEGKGIRKLVKERCDFLVRIPLRGKISSLNASVAAAVVMYEVLRQRRMLGKIC